MKRVLVVLFFVTGATLFSAAAIAKEAHPNQTLHNSTDSHSEAQKLMGTTPRGYVIIPKKSFKGEAGKLGSVEFPTYTKEFFGNIKTTSPIPERRIEFKPGNSGRIGIVIQVRI